MRPSRRRFLEGASASIATISGLGVLSGVGAAKTYTVDSDLTVPLDISGSQLDNAIRQVRSDSPLIGLGDTWVDVGHREGIDAVYMAAHAAWESAWGTSDIARDKNNIYGWKAYDSCPYSCAESFSSKSQCIREVMPVIRQNYLSPDGQYYTSHGPTLRGMNVHYATDSNWKYGIRDVMNSLTDHIDFGGGGGFSDGDIVRATTDLNTREQPGLDSPVVATMPAGSTGEIVNGPTDKDGYTWWGVHWTPDDIWGWSVERYLELA